MGVGPKALAQDQSWQKLGLEEGLPAARHTDFKLGPGGFYWLATEGAGLVRYDAYRFHSETLADMPLISGLLADSSGLWLYNEQKALYYDGFRQKSLRWPAAYRLRQLAMGAQLYALMRDGSLWQGVGDSLQLLHARQPGAEALWLRPEGLYLSGQQGLYRWQPQEGTWEQLSRRGPWQLFAEGGAVGAGVYYPHFPAWREADSSRAWRGGLEQAGECVLYDRISLYRRQGRDWQAFWPPDGLSLANLRALYLSPESTLVLSDGRALYLTQLDGEQRFSAGLEGPVYALAEHRDALYVASARGLLRLGEGGLQALSPPELILSLCTHQDQLYYGTERGLFRWQAGESEALDWPGEAFVFSLLSQGESLWLGSSQGVWEKRGETWIDHSEEADLPRAGVFAAQAAPDGSLWFATYTQGLLRYHGQQWKAISHWQNLALDSLNYNCLWPEDSSAIWLGTANDGLYYLKAEGWEHFRFSELGFAEIQALAMVAGELWVGTNKGSISLSELRRRRREASDEPLDFRGPGLEHAAFLASGKYLWAGGEEQLSRWPVDPAGPPPKAQIWQVQLLKGAGNRVFSDSLSPFLALPQQLDLPHDYNYLRFNYGATELYHGQSLRYRYRLLGQSEAWTYAGRRREAIFTDLKPHRYRFEVQARRPGEDWPQQAALYDFVIRSPLWQRWWFISLALLLSGLSIYAILRQRWRGLKERLTLQSDLQEMERKALRLQMNPHFIFNALDSISSFIFREEPKQAVRYLNNFAKLMRGTLESSMEPLYPVEEEVAILQHYLELEKLRFNDQFDYQIDMDPSIDYDLGLPPMLVQPHVENAILHGLKNKTDGRGLLQISFERQGDILCCTVRDNGIGRKAAKQKRRHPDHRSMATQINKDRIRLLRKSRKAEVALHIEDLYHPDGRAAGTLVRLRLPAEEL